MPSQQLNPRPVSAWTAFWFERMDPLPLAVFRVVAGFFLMWTFICLYQAWDAYYGLAGVLSLNDISFPNSGDDWWSLFHWTQDVLSTRALWWLGFLAAVGFTAGWKTRFWTVLLYLVQASMIHRNRWVTNGEDLVFGMLLFYACFADLSRVGSLDRWLEIRRAGGAPLSPEKWPLAWPVRLMQITITLVYVISLPNKLADDVAWRNGHAIYLSMVSSLWSRFPWPSIFYNGILSAFFTYGTILTEGLFPILVWFKRTRLYALAAIASLHVGIAIFLKNVTFFSLSMVCSFILFLPGETLRAAAQTMKGVTSALRRRD